MMDTYLLSLSLSLSELKSLELLPPPDPTNRAAATVASKPAASVTFNSLFKYFEIIHKCLNSLTKILNFNKN